MTVDNIELIKTLLSFETEDDFYFLQILQRKKENPNLGSNSRVIKNYYIGSIEYLDSRYEEIKKLCEVFNARATINLNKRSYYKVAFKNLENVANTISNKSFKSLSKTYQSACGQTHNDPNKKWILDIDFRPIEGQHSIFTESIENLGGKVLKVIPSKSGVHYITSPFRLDKFKQDLPYIEVHKNNPTNLYIP